MPTGVANEAGAPTDQVARAMGDTFALRLRSALTGATSGSHITQLRPLRFAAYNAASARCSMLLTVSPPGLDVATPMLAVMLL